MSRKPKGEGGFVKNNIRNLREQAGISQGELAEKSGLSKSYLSRLEASKRRFSLDIAEKIAQGLDVPRSSIVDVPDGGTISVTVKGTLQAGVWTEGTEWPHEDFYEVTVLENGLYEGAKRHACEVAGPSMNKVYPEGTVLVWVSMHDIKEPMLPGKRYILNRTAHDGKVEHTVKTYMRDPAGKEWFYPESTDPKFQEPIEMAAPNGSTALIQVAGRVINSIRDE